MLIAHVADDCDGIGPKVTEQGNGRGIAVAFAKEGAKVVVAEIKPDTGEAVAEECPAPVTMATLSFILFANVRLLPFASSAMGNLAAAATSVKGPVRAALAPVTSTT